jgi:hypothetical protein
MHEHGYDRIRREHPEDAAVESEMKNEKKEEMTV